MGCAKAALTFLIIFGILQSNAEQTSLDETINTLKSLPRTDGLILLNVDIFDEYIIPSRRNFSLVFIMGSKKARCDPCGPAMDALSNIAYKWESEHKDSTEIFFGFLDFRDNIDFVKRLDVTTAPFIYHVGPHQSMSEWDKVSDYELVSEPVRLAEWISKMSNIQVEATIPMDLTLIYLGCLLLSAAYLFYKVQWFRSAKFVGVICLMFICTMLSGFMWVNIHKVPFISAQEGKLLYMYPQNGAQFGCEVLLIMSFYAMTSGGLVLLTNKCPKYRKQKLIHFGCVLACLGLTALGFNQMAACYQKKSGIGAFQ